MKCWSAVLLSVAVALGLSLVGCSDDDTTLSNPIELESEYTYLGNNGEACLHCHAYTVFTMEETGHTKAYSGLDEDDKTNLYCLQCHTTGFDATVAFGDTVVAPGNEGPDVDGYDDYVGLNTEEAVERRAALEGVQCESCHGPMGSGFPAHRPEISFATVHDTVTGEWDSNCFPCHEGQLEEYLESGHGTVTGSLAEFNTEHYVNNPSCDFCHTSEGFIRENDRAYASYDFPPTQSFIGCPTCHDPHLGEDGGGNEAQLRNVGPVEVNYDFGTDPGDEDRPAMAGYGTAQTCAQCHRARRGDSNVAGQIANGYAHFGPHGSPQMDMFIGAGCYEIPAYTYSGTHVHQSMVTKACVDCHMVREVMLHGELQDHSFHTFEPNVDNCLPCHQGLADFDYNGVQTDIMGKMDQLAQVLGYNNAQDYLDNFDSQAVGVTAWQREAAYALQFVNNDGSYGVHNPAYANSLLDNAITYVQSQTP